MILTIGIPTYNNQQTIRGTLNSIIHQISGLDVEILICDNCSKDDTLKIIKEEYIEKYPDIKIRYHINKNNLGASKNIKIVLDNAQGDFVWMCGDDKIKDGSIKYLATIINKYKDLGVIIVKSEVYDDNFSSIIHSRKKTNNGEDILCVDQFSFLKHSRDSVFFLTSIVINRNCWKKIKNEIDFNSYYPQTDLTLKISKNHKSYVVDKSLVIENHNSWGNKFSFKKRMLITFDMVDVIHKNFQNNRLIRKVPQYKIARNFLRRFISENHDARYSSYIIKNFLKYKIHKYKFFGLVIKFLNIINPKYSIFFVKKIFSVKN